MGALAGGKQLDAATMQATFAESAPVSTRSLYGQSFDVPKSEKDIGDEFRRLVHGARERKSRIKMVASEGSGYGLKYVPVLAANDYTLEEGESSVFASELGGAEGAKEACALVKRKMCVPGRDYAHETGCLACFPRDDGVPDGYLLFANCTSYQKPVAPAHLPRRASR